MVEAYIFIDIRAGWAKKILREIAELSEVTSVHACWGRPDLISHIKVADLRKLRELVLQRFQHIEGITATDTHIVIEA